MRTEVIKIAELGPGKIWTFLWHFTSVVQEYWSYFLWWEAVFVYVYYIINGGLIL